MLRVYAGFTYDIMESTRQIRYRPADFMLALQVKNALKEA
jgi:hypothetical protein